MLRLDFSGDCLWGDNDVVPVDGYNDPRIHCARGDQVAPQCGERQVTAVLDWRDGPL